MAANISSSGSVAPHHRIAVSATRRLPGDGGPMNGRTMRYPGAATSAVPGALFEYCRPSITARSSKRGPRMAAAAETSMVWCSTTEATSAHRVNSLGEGKCGKTGTTIAARSANSAITHAAVRVTPFRVAPSKRPRRRRRAARRGDDFARHDLVRLLEGDLLDERALHARRRRKRHVRGHAEREHRAEGDEEPPRRAEDHRGGGDGERHDDGQRPRHKVQQVRRDQSVREERERDGAPRRGDVRRHEGEDER